MLDFLFGEYGLRFLIAFVVVLLVIAVGVWVARRFGTERLGGTGARGRQPRLAVIDAATVDSRRRLILIRRDNVEHLLMIGGPTDVVVEANIVRAGQQRDTAPTRPPAAPEAPARTAPLGDGSTWPLQPDPAPTPLPLPAPRPQRPVPAPTVEEPAQWQAEAEQPPPPAPVRQPRQPVDPLAGLAAELSRQPPPTPPTRLPREREPLRERETARELLREREAPREREAVREREAAREREPEPPREAIRDRGIARDREPAREREVTREREAARSIQAQPTAQVEGQFGAAADQNLADMAQRLEAALRRPGKPETAAEPKVKAPNVEPMVQAPPAEPMVVAAEPIALEPRAARGDGKPVREARAGGQRPSMYDSLEQEMASLLGRPGGKN